MDRDPYLQAMGITQWQRRERAAAVPQPVDEDVPESTGARIHPGVYVEEVSSGVTDVADVTTAAATTTAQGGKAAIDVSELGWDALEASVNACTACDLYSSRTNAVFGVGDRDADWLIIGEAPGADEDRQGEPFVGRAGMLLTSMIEALGYKREQVYIANILKCRPPGNRDPQPEEVMNCQHYLRRQIELIQPRVILAVGRVAAQNLLGTDKPMKSLRGQRFEYADTGIPLMVTYHPAYLLRSPKEKRKAWQDLRQAMQVYKEAN